MTLWSYSATMDKRWFVSQLFELSLYVFLCAFCISCLAANFCIHLFPLPFAYGFLTISYNAHSCENFLQHLISLSTITSVFLRTWSPLPPVSSPFHCLLSSICRWVLCVETLNDADNWWTVGYAAWINTTYIPPKHRIAKKKWKTDEILKMMKRNCKIRKNVTDCTKK